jgi:hypothetical protein
MKLKVTETTGTRPDGSQAPLWLVDIERTEPWEHTAYAAAGVAETLASWDSAENAERVASDHVRAMLRALSDALAIAAATVATAVPMHEPPTEPVAELVPGGSVPRLARLRGEP